MPHCPLWWSAILLPSPLDPSFSLGMPEWSTRPHVRITLDALVPTHMTHVVHTRIVESLLESVAPLDSAKQWAFFFWLYRSIFGHAHDARTYILSGSQQHRLCLWFHLFFFWQAWQPPLMPPFFHIIRGLASNTNFFCWHFFIHFIPPADATFARSTSTSSSR